MELISAVKTKKPAKSRTRNSPFLAAPPAPVAAKGKLNGYANAASACGPSAELRAAQTYRTCCCKYDADEGHRAGQHVAGNMKSDRHMSPVVVAVRCRLGLLREATGACRPSESSDDLGEAWSGWLRKSDFFTLCEATLNSIEATPFSTRAFE